MSLILLNEDELRQVITLSEAIEVVEGAFTASAESRINIPGDFVLKLPEVKGEVDVKGTYLQEAPYYVIKVANNFQNNPDVNLPTNSGLIAVFDAATGFPAAIMIDNGYLTNIRAGAAGALAVQYLANKKIDQVAVLGAGNEAYIHLKSLMVVRDIGWVFVWDQSPMVADTYARLMVEDHDLNIQIATSIEEAVQQADIIIMTTGSEEPLLQSKWLKPGVHITTVSNNTPHKQELYTDVLQRADVIIVDNLEQYTTMGEIHHGLEAGVITKEDIQGELSHLIIDEIPGRTDPNQITLADLTGLDSQDAVVATLALEKALFLGLGQQIGVGLGQGGRNPLVENIL